jgi:hypothetical protein
MLNYFIPAEIEIDTYISIQKIIAFFGANIISIAYFFR